MTHRVAFKCIGCTKELHYHKTLAQVSSLFKMGNAVKCNPVDARAITFKCHVDNNWQGVGYVVKEALEEVHDVMQSSLLVRAGFEWVKYRLLPRLVIWHYYC